MTQADLTVAIFSLNGQAKRTNFFGRKLCPRITALTEQLSATAAFQATLPEAVGLTRDM